MIAHFRQIGFLRIILCAILGLAGAWFALAIAISGVTRIKMPQTALAAIPIESTALASRADQLFFANQKNPPPQVAKLARKALKAQAINSKALRILGFVADVQGDTAQAERFLLMAAKLSRREAGAQLWLIEAAARENNLTRALVHYDIALRTEPDTQNILFPRLLSSIKYKDVRAALKPYIRAEDGWVANFLYFANANSQNLPALVDLIVETGGLANPENSRIQKLGLLSRLVNENHFNEARRLFLQFPDAKVSRLTNIRFEESDRDGRFGSMSWQIIDDLEAGASFINKPDEELTLLSIFANPATTQRVASKLLYLKPGRYLFFTRLSNIDRGTGGFLRWQMRCPPISAAPAWTIDTIDASLRAEFEVPVNCPVQFLDLVASGGDGRTGLEATVSFVSVATLDNLTEVKRK